MLKRTLLVTGLLLASFPAVRSQVVIREKMVINPRAGAQINSASTDGSHSLRAVLTQSELLPMRLFVNRVCGDLPNNGEPYIGTGQIDFVLDSATNGEYQFFAQTAGHATFMLYTDDTLAFEAHEDVDGSHDSYNWYPRTDFGEAPGWIVPFASGLSMYPLSNCLQSGGTTTMAVIVSAGCSQQIRWSPARDVINFNVLQGSDLGRFQSRDGIALGTVFSLTASDARNMRFIAREGLEHGGVVELEAVVGPIRRTATINVVGLKDMSLAIDAFPSDVQHGEEVELTARTVGCNGSTVIPPDSLTFTLRILEGRQWGRLSDEETGKKGDSLAGIPQHSGEARIWFQAWEESPAEPEQVTVELSASDPDIAPATLDLFVTPGGLKIVVAPPTLAYGEKSTITVQKLLPDGTTEPLSPEATITYRIVNGTTAGTLQNADSTEYGDEILTSESQWLFAAKEEEPQPDEVEVIVQIEVEEGIIIISGADGQEGPALQSNATKEGHQQITGEKTASTSSFYGLSGVAKIAVRKGIDLDHFQVIVVPDTVFQGDTAQVYVQAKDAHDQDVHIPGETALDFSLTEGSDVAHLHATEGSLNNVLYGTVRIGGQSTMRLIARPLAAPPVIVAAKSPSQPHALSLKTTSASGAEVAPDTIWNAVIAVIRSHDASRRGEGLAVIRQKLILSIKDHEPWTVWPLLPAQTDGDSRGADRPGYDPKRDFTIVLRDGLGQRIEGRKINITTTFEQGTGGHGHVNGERALPQNKQGVFYGQGKSGNPLNDLMTGADGTAKIDSFLASQVSGKFLVTASLSSDKEVKDTVQMTIRVPGLVEFPDSSYWNLTGTTTTGGQNHPSNHWCTTKMRDSLIAAIKDFYDWTVSDTGAGKAVALDINDMSLEWGGAFDIHGRWNLKGDHSFHRVGLSVDIERDPGGLRRDDGVLTRSGERLKTIVETYGGKKYKEENIHFGFDGGN